MNFAKENISVLEDRDRNNVPLKKIIIIIPYFGKWPEWFPLYLESCLYNPTINWLFYTDCNIPTYRGRNIEFKEMSFNEYISQIEDKLDIRIKKKFPFKLCDLKPAYGLIHQLDTRGYDYFGFGDIDVIYGDLRKFLTPKVLTYNVVSTLPDRISGHFSIFKNNTNLTSAFQKIKDWKLLMSDEKHLSIDEKYFSDVFLGSRIVIGSKKYPLWLRKLYSLTTPYRPCLFKEFYTTILDDFRWIDGSLDHPETWYWKKGKLTNIKDGDREFMYLHFMNWKYNRWLPKFRGKIAAWESLQAINHVSPEQICHGWRIDRKGFHPLQSVS